MKAYDLGVKAALQKVAVYPEEYNASGNFGMLGGGALGALAGGYAGHELGKHIGRSTRAELLGMPIPGTGAGEHFFSHNTGPLIGEALGGLAGAGVGGAMGLQGGHLTAIRKAPPPRRVMPDPSQLLNDPRLMQYLLGSQGGGQ